MSAKTMGAASSIAKTDLRFIIGTAFRSMRYRHPFPNWIEGRANLKTSEVMAERNVEVRRAGIEILG